MATPNSGRRRGASKLTAAEDEAFNQVAKEAEARLAARRQARAEAREIRMKELEKQQREADEQSDRHYELLTDASRNNRPARDNGRSASYISGASSYASSRRSSEDSTDALDLRELRASLDGRDLKFQVTDLEEKFRKAMISNAQLDNEKSAYTYQVETLCDDMEELQENFYQVVKEYKAIKRLHDQLKRDFKTMKEENDLLKQSVKQRDQLIKEHGLVLVEANAIPNGDLGENDSNSGRETPIPKKHPTRTHYLVSPEIAQVVEYKGKGSVDLTVRSFLDEKDQLLDEIYRLRCELDVERQKTSKTEHMAQNQGPQASLPETKIMEVQREANKQVNDYKYRLKKAEQEKTSLQSNISRLESQVTRYKTATENAEKVEDDLKAEKRKLQRELRETQSRIEELETANAHLQKRIDKLKSARSALIKS